MGQTTRHFDTRVHEHLHKKTQPSSVFKHLEQNARCREACDVTCFTIIDRDVSSFRLEVKETIHNEWVKPTINKQKKLLKLSILIWTSAFSPFPLSPFFSLLLLLFFLFLQHYLDFDHLFFLFYFDTTSSILLLFSFFT